MTNKELPELLMPAGDIDKAYTAFRYGADAIYCGLPMFSLRTRENVFTEENLEEIVKYAHGETPQPCGQLPFKKGERKKVYVTTNAFPHQYLIPLYEKHFKFLEKIQPDGIIFADLGVLSLANEFAPTVPKHLSVQTSTVNAPAINLWKSLGVERIILAREMAIREVAQIHKLIPDMELEYFVHGAVCMAYSGRCLLSNFTGGRDANRGACNHTCRWNYQVHDEEGRSVDVSTHEDTDDTKGLDGCCSEGEPKSIRDFEEHKLVEEETRRGELIPMEEDFHGTHIMSSKDMCMIEFLKDIVESGVCSLKVEGRNKTAYYAATIARAYRQALDDMAAGKPFDESLWREVHATANRGFFPGFLHGKPGEGSMQYKARRSESEKEFCARVLGWKEGRAIIEVKNRIEVGSEIEIVMPKIADDFVITAEDLKFGNTEVETLHGGNDNKTSSLKCEKEIPEGVFIRQKVTEK